MKKFNSILHMYSNMDNSSQILLFLIILVSLMLVSIFIINYATKRRNERILSGGKKKKVTKIKTEIEKEIKPSVDIKNKNIEEPKKEILDIIEEEIKNKEEVEEVVKVVPRKTSIEDITKLIEDTLEQEPINLTKFEEDQEENAIISYDELVKRAGAKKIVYKCEDENDILDISTKKEEIKVQPVETKIEEPKRFKASQVISPIFGVQKQKEEPDEVLESFIDLEDFSLNEKKENTNESKNDMEFLTSLKEFRSGLE